MNNLAGRLGGGDLRSIGDAEAVARALERNHALVDQAVSLMSAKDPLLRARSADALQKAARRNPAILRRHKKTLLRVMAAARQKEVRWHIAQMVPLIALTARERPGVFTALRGYLNDESRIVQVCALQALWDLTTSEERSRMRFRMMVEDLAVNGAPAVQARARRLLRVGRGRRARG